MKNVKKMDFRKITGSFRLRRQDDEKASQDDDSAEKRKKSSSFKPILSSLVTRLTSLFAKLSLNFIQDSLMSKIISLDGD